LAQVDLTRRAEIGRQKRARTRAGIIETALRVVAERGFDAPTIDEFVDAAQVARGTFYNYFETREELLAAVAAHVVDEIDSALLPIYASTDDPARRMSVALRHFTIKSRERPDWGWLIVRMIPIRGGPLSEEMRKGVLQDLTSGKRSGRFKIASVEAALAFGMGTLMMSIRTALSSPVPTDFAESMASMLLQGYGVPAREASRLASLPMPPETQPIVSGRSDARPRVARTRVKSRVSRF